MKEMQCKVRAPNPFPQDIYQKLITLENQKAEFRKGMNILMTDKH